MSARENIARWVREGAIVRLDYAQPNMEPHAVGRVIGYYDAPTVIVETADGTHVTWLASLASEALVMPPRMPDWLTNLIQALESYDPNEHEWDDEP